jgi:predicted RNase H-like nuclease (RuvC/YqgF family)
MDHLAEEKRNPSVKRSAVVSKAFAVQDIDADIKKLQSKIDQIKQDSERLSEEVEQLDLLAETNEKLEVEIEQMQDLLAQTLENEKNRWEVAFADFNAKSLEFDFINRSIE